MKKLLIIFCLLISATAFSQSKITILDRVGCGSTEGIPPAGDSTAVMYETLDSTCTVPGSPSTNDAYMVCAIPSGAWSGHAFDIATWDGAAWVFTDPNEGDYAETVDDHLNYIFRSGAWRRISGIPLLVGGNRLANTISGGTIDNNTFILKTNNVNRLSITGAGDYVFHHGMTGSGNVLFGANNSGVVQKVSAGNGISLSASTISADTSILSTRNWRLKLADSLGAIIATKGTGTVTSVATNTGTGITGGTITSTGTIAADTTVLSTRAWRDKLKDSLGAILTRSLDTVGVVNVADYVINGGFGTDTTAAINQAIRDAAATERKTVRFSTAASPYVVQTHHRSVASSTNKKGIELVSNITVIIDPGVTIYADTAVTATTANAKFYPIFNGYGVSNVTIDGSGGSTIDGQMTTFGNYTTNPYTNPAGYFSDTSLRWSTSGIQFFYGSNNKVRNVYVQNCQLEGFMAMYTTAFNVSNSTFFRNGSSGVEALRRCTGDFNYIICDSNASDQIRVDTCTIGIVRIRNSQATNSQANASATNWFAGIYIAGSSHVHTDNVYLADNSAYGYDNASDSTYKDNTLTNSWIEYNRNAGATANGSLTIKNNSFINNGKNHAGATDTKSTSGYNPAAIAAGIGTALIIEGNHSIDTVSGGNWAQTYFIKTTTGGSGFYRSTVNNNYVKGVADTAHFRNGNLGQNNFLNNLIYKNTNLPVLEFTSSYIWGYDGTYGNGAWTTIPASTPTLTSTQIAFGDGSNNMTSSANLTYSGGAITGLNTAIGTSTTTATPSFIATNTTAAAAGAQQESPSFAWIGQGWKTTATAASQAMKFSAKVIPVQGTTNALGNWTLSTSVNGGGDTKVLSVNESGAVSAGAGVSTATTSGFQGAFAAFGGGTLATTATIRVAKSGGASSTGFIAGIDMAGITLANTAASTAAGILAGVTGNTNPNASGTQYGIESKFTSSGAVTTSPLLVGGLHAEFDFNVNSTGVTHTKAAAIDAEVQIISTATKTLTTAYGVWSHNSVDLSGGAIFTNYHAFRADSINNSAVTNTPFGVDIRGSNYINNIGGKTRLGDATATAPTSTVDIAGSFSVAYVAKSADYTATISEHTVEITAATKTITLPTAVGITGRIYTVKLTASGTTGTVATTSSQTIDGSTTYSLSAQYKYVSVQSNGANWIVIANN